MFRIVGDLMSNIGQNYTEPHRCNLTSLGHGNHGRTITRARELRT